MRPAFRQLSELKEVLLRKSQVFVPIFVGCEENGVTSWGDA